MFKFTTAILAAIGCGSMWYGGGEMPRATGSDLDYALMPFLGYLLLMAVAHLIGRIVPETKAS